RRLLKSQKFTFCFLTKNIFNPYFRIINLIMATIINNPPNTASQTNGDPSGNYVSLILVVFVIFFIILAFYFGMPLLRRATTSSAPQVNVPGKIDVNVNGPSK